MLEQSAAYRAAITGDARHILLRADIKLIDPDIQMLAPETSAQAAFARPEQIQNFVFDAEPEYLTLERNRWLLDGSGALLPRPEAAEIGAVSAAISGEDGSFAEPQIVQENFSGVSVLQACTVFFPAAEKDGVAADFAVEVLQGGTAYHTADFFGNTERKVVITGFTVYTPDAIRVTVTRWNLPGRRMRVPEIIPGLYEEWDNNIIAAFDVRQEANFSCLALPYGTCTLRMDNLDRRFESRSKDGIFKSIEERQGITVSVGVKLPDGSVDYKRLGIFYQYSGGWKTGDNGITMQWELVDIVGLLSKREFVAPAQLPTTLDGWIAALAAQLGENFRDRYHVDPNYAELPVTVNDAADLKDATCGSILRWVCMATGTWPRADAETGDLTAEPFWSQGNKLDLDNMTTYPVMRANDDLAAIIFTLYDGRDTKYIVSGTTTASSDTVSVSNPFIHNEAAALTAARMILSTYGGNRLEATGRGDPSSEIGDVDTVWLNESSATTGRRQLQTFRIQNGVLQNCESVLLQADGAFLFEERVTLTGSGAWRAPAGVSRLRVILVGRGEDGTDGTDGSWDASGVDGEDGAGALVWSATIDINEAQEFEYDCGADTVFGAYSSADGKRYPLGYTDVASGDSFARSGVAAPKDGTGDGGRGGKGGVQGRRHTTTKKDYTVGGTLPGNTSGVYIPVKVTVVDNMPGKGTPGAKGASGCVVVYWDKEDA